MLKSNRAGVSKKLRDELSERNQKAAIVTANQAKQFTPVGTPESTGIPGYVGGRLRASVTWAPAPGGYHEGFAVGTNVKYGVYVHNGTYDYKSDFSNYESGEIFEAERKNGGKGMPARPFLVNGINAARPEMKAIYKKPIKE